MEWPEMRYKELVLVPGLAEDDGMYAVKLVIRSPDGIQHTTSVLGDFPCPIAIPSAFTPESSYPITQFYPEPLTIRY